ncbi:TPA: hypothetical protein TZS71_000654 [Streptococcus suis]|nr:hypothetical protein [Streptococcus suis]
MIPKFRAWDVHNKKMLTESELVIWSGNVYANDYQKIFKRFMEGARGLVGYSVDDKFLMQSTGLFDANGKEVYIGDIVKCTSGCSHEVIFLKEYGGRYIGGMPAIYLSDIREGYAWTEDEEIIGNIYENPELVEVLND